MSIESTKPIHLTPPFNHGDKNYPSRPPVTPEQTKVSQEAKQAKPDASHPHTISKY